MTGFAKGLAADRRGTPVVELALVLPLFLVLLYGILGYAQYFLLAHSVQQLANDAARATIPSLSVVERATLASAAVTAEAATLAEIDTARLSTLTEEGAGFVTVRVRYDAGSMPLMRTLLIPMPDPMIERRAVVRCGST